jgi:hypothetical protein
MQMAFGRITAQRKIQSEPEKLFPERQNRHKVRQAQAGF